MAQIMNLGLSRVDVKTRMDTMRAFIDKLMDSRSWTLTKAFPMADAWATPAPSHVWVYNSINGTETLAESYNGDVILSGLLGEQRVISGEDFRRIYKNVGKAEFTEFDTSGMNGGWTLVKSRDLITRNIWAIQVPFIIKNFPVYTHEGHCMLANDTYISGHGSGDFICCKGVETAGGAYVPNLDDMYVVHHNLFIRTHDVSAFRGETQLKPELPVFPAGIATRHSMIPIGSPIFDQKY